MLFTNLRLLCSAIDQFGVTYTPTIHQNQRKFKTIIGGLASIVLYGLAFAYTLYIIYQWTQNQLIPKISSIQKVALNQDLYLSQPFELEIFNLNEFTGDPFSSINNILTPFFFKVTEKTFSPISCIFSNIEEVIPEGGSGKITKDNVHLQLDIRNTSDQQQDQFLIGLMRCQEIFLIQGQQCATKEVIDNFFQSNLVLLNFRVILKQYDAINNNFTTIMKEVYPILESTSSIYQQVLIKTSHTTVNNGIIFPNEEVYEYISDVDYQAQTLQTSQLSLLGIDTVYASFLMKFNNRQEFLYIQYPQLGEVMAQIGSIVTLVLLLSHIVQFFNTQQMEQFLVDQIIKFYYPDFETFKIKTNLRGNIKEVRLKDKTKQINLQQFSILYQKIRESARQKLNILNLLYEVSRIQFILQSLQDRENIKRSRHVGIRLPLKNKPFKQTNDEQNHDKSRKVMPLSLSEDIEEVDEHPLDLLIGSDIELLMLNSDSYLSEQKHSMELPFYKINDLRQNKQEKLISEKIIHNL